ncbi:redoxin domain-containing protein, partial [Streptomyces sp. 13-12-16]
MSAASRAPQRSNRAPRARRRVLLAAAGAAAAALLVSACGSGGT